MRYYSYFPGCCMHEDSRAYDTSAQAVAEVLDTELIRLEDWNCCGSTPYTVVDELAAFCCCARNLALAEKRGLDLVAACSDCYLILARTNQHFKEYPEIRRKINEALAVGSLEYHGTIKVRHILDVFANDISHDEISSRIKVDLSRLKVAPYYGCQVIRPTPSFDDPEYPQSLDRLTQSLGAQVVPFPLKTRCCGGSLILSEEDIALGLIHKLLGNAASNGADCIVTVCPFCHLNLDAYQSAVNRKFKTNFSLPILFFTQLMGIAFGI
ncbi:MAG: CoB--CoM heterodisulfide reductase iron-sulfur subunit B family protein, partial [Dehalococcoidia bacterium]|nr:CoB--CoM heterodisulfide reductase iron-sulfur subunit B family protein [Dehalococcoidia bacterium]